MRRRVAFASGSAATSPAVVTARTQVAATRRVNPAVSRNRQETQKSFAPGWSNQSPENVTTAAARSGRPNTTAGGKSPSPPDGNTSTISISEKSSVPVIERVTLVSRTPADGASIRTRSRKFRSFRINTGWTGADTVRVTSSAACTLPCTTAANKIPTTIIQAPPRQNEPFIYIAPHINQPAHNANQKPIRPPRRHHDNHPPRRHSVIPSAIHRASRLNFTPLPPA